MIWPHDRSNEQPHDQAGEFKAKNLVAILHAVPQTDGTCSAVASNVRKYESMVLASTLEEWLQEGHEDLIAGDTETVFARFVTPYEERKRRPDAKAGG